MPRGALDLLHLVGFFCCGWPFLVWLAFSVVADGAHSVMPAKFHGRCEARRLLTSAGRCFVLNTLEPLGNGGRHAGIRSRNNYWRGFPFNHHVQVMLRMHLVRTQAKPLLGHGGGDTNAETCLLPPISRGPVSRSLVYWPPWD